MRATINGTINVTSKHSVLLLIDVRIHRMKAKEKKRFWSDVIGTNNLKLQLHLIIFPYKLLLLSEFKIIWGKRVIDALIKSFSLEYGKPNKIFLGQQKMKEQHTKFFLVSYPRECEMEANQAIYIFGASLFLTLPKCGWNSFHFLIVFIFIDWEDIWISCKYESRILVYSDSILSLYILLCIRRMYTYSVYVMCIVFLQCTQMSS